MNVATNSEQWGGWNESGKYPSKLYNESCVLIYQADNGGGNSGKKPSGGVLSQSLASSMSATVANPITFYYGGSGAVVSQVGQSGDLYNYYFASYSRGTDGGFSNVNWHNLYLDSYIPLRHKSIYDPCPYGYRIPSNGTYNQFNSNPGWIALSYTGGVSWNFNTLGESWFPGLGCNTGYNGYIGNGYWRVSTSCNVSQGYRFVFRNNKIYEQNSVDARSYGFSVRCIEECELLPDAIEN